MVVVSSIYLWDVVSRAAGLLGGAMVSDIVGYIWVDDWLVMKRLMYVGVILVTVVLRFFF